MVLRQEQQDFLVFVVKMPLLFVGHEKQCLRAVWKEKKTE